MAKDDKTGKDEPAADAKPNAELNISKGKIKKTKKKKKHPSKSESSVSSDSISDVNSAPAPLVIDEPAREQFFDAHESYHGIPAPVETQLVTAPVAPVINPLAAKDTSQAPVVPTPVALNETPEGQKEAPVVPSSTPLTPVAPAAGTALLVARSEHGQDPKIAVPGLAAQENKAKKEPSTISKPVTGMDKLSRPKTKNKKQPAAKQKTTKKRKSDGPTCSMFLAELTRRLAAKRREEVESPVNVIQTIVDSITNALPIKISVKTTLELPPIEPTASVLENLRSMSPELIPNDTISVPLPIPEPSNEVFRQETTESVVSDKLSFKMPKMPVVNSEELKTAVMKEARRRQAKMTDATTVTTTDNDVASELAKHVSTLKKISLIAEEFNQKTAKNLKEIVDSVQEDLIKKLEEVQAEQQRARAQSVAYLEQHHEAYN